MNPRSLWNLYPQLLSNSTMCFKNTYSAIAIISFTSFLTLLFLTYWEVLEPPIQVACNFRLPSKDPYCPFSNYIVENTLKGKKIIPINLTGIPVEDDKVMDTIQSQAHWLKRTHDTTQVLKVHFTENNTYGQFMQLVTIMMTDCQARYTLWKDDFYIFGEELPKPQKEKGIAIEPVYM